MANLENLSERDRAVLRSIFDPTATIGDVIDDGDTFVDDDDDSSPSSKESISLCAQAVKLAESKNLAEALVLMTQGVDAAPGRAAAYNDRAQLLRLMLREEEALSDIEKALSLTEGTASRARAQALCQRGVLLRKRGDDDAARTAFAEAARLGSGFAKKQVVELNPYAALCNQMLSQVLKGEDIKLSRVRKMQEGQREIKPVISNGLEMFIVEYNRDIPTQPDPTTDQPSKSHSINRK